MPERTTGIALLWPLHDVVLDHADRETRVRADDLAIVDRSLPIALRGDDGWIVHLLDFGTRSFLLRPGRRRSDLGRAIDGGLPLAQFIKRLWAIGREVDAMHLQEELIASRLIDVIGNLGGMLFTPAIDGKLSRHKATTLERAEMLIAAHLNEPTLSSAALAARMRVSPRHLSSLFAATGTTTTKAILRQRLVRARSLLADPANRHRQIAEIARECGFNDQGYFARCFRKDHDMTPKIFREIQANGTNRNSV